MTQDEEKMCNRIRTIEKVQDVLDRACLGMEIFCIVMNILSGNWICALIWFNVVLWNYRAIRDTAKLKESYFENALLGYLLYSKLDKKEDGQAEQSSDVIDVESKEATSEPSSEEKKA